ncbi:MAG: LysR family transcriptional regulator [Cellvibrio sp.]
MLDLRHLRTLTELRATGSLVEAADRLCVTQSALSHQLKELESRLGGELFIRKSRPLRFTLAGQRLLDLADDVLKKVADAERDLKQMFYGETGRLYMAIECHSCFNWLLPTLDVYRDHWPNVEVDFIGGFLFEPLPALASGEIDLVITSDPQDIKGVQYKPLFAYEMVIGLSKHHALMEKPKIEPSDLVTETLITYPVAHERLDIFKQFLTPAGLAPRQVRTAELTMMIVQLVASGRGFCALPNWALADYVEQGLIAEHRAGQGIWATLYAAIRDEDANKPFMEDFLAKAKTHCLAHLKGVRAA